MKLLLDEMLSPSIARELCSRGRDVRAIKGHAEWESLSDCEVMDLARREERAIVTNNLRDYRPLHHAAITPGGRGHFGMVFMAGNYRPAKHDVGRIVSALEAKLSDHPGERDIADGETWL